MRKVSIVLIALPFMIFAFFNFWVRYEHGSAKHVYYVNTNENHDREISEAVINFGKKFKLGIDLEDVGRSKVFINGLKNAKKESILSVVRVEDNQYIISIYQPKDPPFEEDFMGYLQENLKFSYTVRQEK